MKYPYVNAILFLDVLDEETNQIEQKSFMTAGWARHPIAGDVLAFRVDLEVKVLYCKLQGNSPTVGAVCEFLKLPEAKDGNVDWPQVRRTLGRCH